METLNNYRNLLAKIDELCRGIETRLGDKITCHEGCSSCCTHLSLFPVEAEALAQALTEASEELCERIRNRARTADAEQCPLLEQNRCLLYASRPVICRTHGLPVLLNEEGGGRVDLCRLNGQGLETLEPADILDLERLNALLSTINNLFVQQQYPEGKRPQGRVPMSLALLKDS